jgi:hypothetical protein
MRRLVLLRGVVWGFSIVFSPLLQFVFVHVRLLRGRKGNGRRGGKTMERGKGKGSRIMAYLREEIHIST